MLRRTRALAAAASLCGAAACGKTPPPPSTGSGSVETVRGSERIGWDQRAGDPQELATFRYAIYVDGSRRELADPSCGTAAGPNGYACTGRLPSMTPGPHTLELATFLLDGDAVRESARSAPLQVNVTATGATADAGARGLVPGGRIRVAGLTDLRVEQAADAADPADIAVDADGRLFVAEREGSVRVYDADGRENASTVVGDAGGSGRLVALALDPQIDRTGLVYVLSEHLDPGGAPALRLSRYREVEGRLGQRAVLLDGVAAGPNGASAALRTSGDGRLLVAFDDGGDAQRAGSAASPNGKVLRLDRDGRTPADHGGATQIQLSGLRAPRGIASTDAGTLWIADADPQAGARLIVAAAASVRPHRIRMTASHPLPPDTQLAGIAAYRGDLVPAFRGSLLVATGAGLLRVRTDPARPSRIVGLDRVVEEGRGVRAVTVSPAGAVYVATTGAVYRLVPAR